MIVVQKPATIPSAKVDISLLLKPQDEEETTGVTKSPAVSSRTTLAPAPTTVPAVTAATSRPAASIPATTANVPTSIPAKRLQPAHPAESPAKKQSKWSPEEDALIIELRGSGMKWEDISKRLPGRSAISCRLHYQNYLERRSEWDEDKKNKLARLYERFKAEMWAKVAEEMAIPWRAAEAMHWQLGEQEMARRAGVVPFSLSSSAVDPPASKSRRGGTVMPRLRRESASRPIPPQLPSVEELTAGVPAYAPPPPQSREPYREPLYRPAMPPPGLGNSPSVSQPRPGSCLPSRTCP
ncbi:MYB DNA-binding domain protein [Thermoascus aurantiacus ATCC 26904]